MTGEQIYNKLEILNLAKECAKNIYIDFDPDKINDKTENIEQGISGNILFLIELYKNDPSDDILLIIKNQVDYLFKYCINNPDQNFGLYNGRSGVIYVLIQMFRLTADYQYMEKSRILITPVNKAFLHSNYTTDYLYNGRAGALLVILELYKYSQDESLIDYINEFINVIVSNARLAEAGICWENNDEANLKPSCGFAFGAAGVKYALSLLDNFCQSDALRYIVNETSKYIDSCWVDEFENWGDFSRPVFNNDDFETYRKSYIINDPQNIKPFDSTSWANGTIGILFSDLKNDHNEMFTVDLLNKSVPGTDLTKTKHHSSIASGFDFYFLQNKAGQFSIDAQKIIDTLQKKYLENFQFNIEQGLFFSDLGSAYLMLSSLENDMFAENVFFPCRYNFPDQNSLKFSISLQVSEVRKSLLSKSYPRVISLFEQPAYHFLNEYFESFDETKHSNEIVSFFTFLSCNPLISKSDLERFNDLINLEKQKIDFFKGSKKNKFEFYFENVIYREKVLSLLNEPEEWLLNQTVKISENVCLVSSVWNWELGAQDDLRYIGSTRNKYLTNFRSPGGKFEYLFSMGTSWDDIEFVLNTAYSLLLHQFEEPKTLKNAIDSTFSYVKSLPESTFNEILKEAGGPNIKSNPVSSISDILHVVMLNTFKKWIYMRVLEIC